MTQQRSFRDRLPFPTAAIMAFLYLTFRVFEEFFNDRYWGFDYGLAWYERFSVFNWAFLFLIFTLSILLLVKFPNVGVTVTLGLISLITIYWCILDFPFYAEKLFDGRFRLYELYGIASIFDVIIFLMLTVQSVSTYSNAKMRFLNSVWFLPGILQFTTFSIYLIQCVDGVDFASFLIASVTQLFYALLIMFIGKWLADVSRIKHPDPNRPNETVYNFRAPRPNYVQPPVSPYAPQPPMPPVPPAPHVPVAPVAPIVPPAPYSPTPAPATPDPVQELTKYKEMLDNELITQEEYDAKKKQILNL